MIFSKLFIITLVQGTVQQLYSVQCGSGSTTSMSQLASIQCLNIPQGGPNCATNFPAISLGQALVQAGVSK